MMSFEIAIGYKRKKGVKLYDGRNRGQVSRFLKMKLNSENYKLEIFPIQITHQNIV